MKYKTHLFRYLTVLGSVLVMAASAIYFTPFLDGSSAMAAKEDRPAIFKEAIAPAKSASDVRMVPANFSDLAARVSPAVVNIRTEKGVSVNNQPSGRPGRNPFGNDERFRDFFDRFFGDRMPPAQKQRSLGSGFIVNPDGTIVTNNHVIEGADKITVALQDGSRELDAEVIGRDPQTDIALIKVKSDRKLPAITLGSSEDLQVGQWVVAVGNPFGLSHTVTAGIVSAKGRVIGSGPYDDFIQTDTSINPGNSGGPLINMRGEVVGINTMIIAGGQGIGFAIPIDMAKEVVQQLARSGRVTRGWLGVTIQDVSDELADYYDIEKRQGALVTSVVPGDPADRAGIKPNDLIVAVNGETVDNSRDLTRKVARLDVGESAKVNVLREGREKVFTVNIVQRSDRLAAAAEKPQRKESDYGFQVTALTPELSRRLNLPSDRGLMVSGVTPGSRADQAGMVRGDVILEINRTKIESVEQLKAKLAEAGEEQNVSLLVQRPNQGLVIINLA